MLAGVYYLHSSNCSSDTCIQSLERQSQISTGLAKLESMGSDINRVKASLEAVHRQLYTTQSVVTVVDAHCYQHRALNEAKAQKRLDLEGLLS